MECVPAPPPYETISLARYKIFFTPKRDELACLVTVPFDCHHSESILKLRIMILSYQRIASESKKKFNSYLLFISFTSVVYYIKDKTKCTCKTNREQKIHVTSNIILEAVLLLLCSSVMNFTSNLLCLYLLK